MDVFKTLLLDTPDSLNAITGTLQIANGGTGATDAAGARDNLLPDYTGNVGKVLTVNAGATDVEWTTNGAGTVTSVDVSGGTTGLTTSGGPVTSSGTITLAGTLAVANGGTGITSLGSGVATFLGTPSSANLAAAVTDETGTGALVFASSPTLVTPTLGAATATSINGVTVTGTSTPALSVTGTTAVSGTNTGDQTTITGNAGTATILQTARNINGVSFDGSADITVAAAAGTLTGATLAAGVTASSLTSLGTIASLTATDLTVNDNTTLGSSNSDTVNFNARVASDINPSADNTYDLGVTGHEWRNLNIDGTANIDSLVADTADINGGTIDGTAIGGSTAAAGAFTTLSASGAFTGVSGVFQQGALPYSLLIGADNAATTLTNATLKASRLVMPHYTNAEEGVALINASSQSTINVVSIGGGSGSLNTATQVDLYAAANNTTTTGTLVAQVTSTGLAVTGALSSTTRITTNDSVARSGVTNATVTAINTSAAGSASPSLYVENNSDTGNGALYVYAKGSRTGTASAIVTKLDGTATSYQIAFFNDNGTVGSISTNGSATTFNTSSDYRLKEITGPLVDSGTFIDALKPKTGTWKVDGSKFAGFLAHEFAEVSPLSVSGEKDAVDADGKPIYQSMQASSSEVMANLVAELQSVRKRLAALEA